ncbi:MAG: rod shape-determining protein MreC [Halothiobacillaceae bacterium]
MARLFIKERPDPVWLAVLLLTSLGLYLADARLNLLDPVRGWLMAGVEPIQRLAALPTQLWHSATKALQSRAALQDELVRLRQENLLLKAQMQTFWAQQEENRRLRNLLRAVQPLEQDLLLAESLPVKGDTRRQTILINRGRRDGVFVGQAVLAAEGLLGQVVHVGPHTAEVLLLTDDMHAVPVRIARTGQRAIARGTGQSGRLEILHLPNNADVREGDLLITSGLGGTFPANYPVASVSVIEQTQSGVFANISARPLAPVDDVREVILVWMRNASSTNIPAHAP